MKELNIPTKPNPASSLFLIDKFLQQHKPATATPVHGRRSKRTRNGNSIPPIYTTISPRNKEARDNNNEDNADEEDRDNSNVDVDNAGNNTEEPIVPKPKKGTVYGLGEFIDIITQYKWKSVTRGRMMKSMISHGYKQHLARTKADINEDESRFYALYPSKMSSRSTSALKRGTFESLDAYVGVCFTYENIPGCFSGKHGLLEHTAEEEEWISNINFQGKSGEQKYMQMAAYLFELGYDLALAKVDNVSQSPGFEGCGLRKID
jgi:hypothetical protein